MCRWLVDNGFADCPLHFSRFFPQYKMQGPMSVLAVTPMGVKDAGASFVPTPLPLLVEARRVAISQDMRHVYLAMSRFPEPKTPFAPVAALSSYAAQAMT